MVRIRLASGWHPGSRLPAQISREPATMPASNGVVLHGLRVSRLDVHVIRTPDQTVMLLGLGHICDTLFAMAPPLTILMPHVCSR